MPRIPLGRAYALASTVAREARRAGLPFDDLRAVGGVRRYAPEVEGIAVLVVAPPERHAQLRKGFARLPITRSADATARDRIIVEIERGTVTIHFTAPERAGAALLWHTGSSTHLDRLQQLAQQAGLTLESATLRRRDASIDCPSEEDVYRILGLPYIAPELREGDTEIDAALAGRLPVLIENVHMRGDLHTHSSWSDGRDSIEAMVGAGRQLGYEYLAITDHSQRAWSSRKLSLDDVARQRQEIDELRARTRGIHILHGVEVDILHDGALDFDDEVLAQFDIVLASLHDDAGHDGQRLTERYLRAIRHPLVNVITHPSNRTPGQSEGYDLDFARLFAAAVDTGTALEIDGAPGHLDMDGTLARAAAAAGVLIAVDSDSHRAEWLARQMRFGVATARRGWIEPQQVLNTRSLEDVRTFIGRKRAVTSSR